MVLAKSKSELTDRQEAFVQELIKGKSQREAYRAAYTTSATWKDSAVDTQASTLFNNRKVQARYTQIKEKLVKEAEEECIASAKDVLRELCNLAFSDATDYARIVTRERNGNLYQDLELTDTKDLPKSKRVAIAGFKQGIHGIEVKMHDKVKSLELVGKMLGAFTEKVELSGEIKNPFEGLTTEDLKKLIRDE